jgi:hypothetical protein
MQKLLIAILSLCFVSSYAQPMFKVWETFGKKETIAPEAIVQDGEGFLWIGTYSRGLLRFDGTSIYTFDYDQEDASSINSNFVTSLACWEDYIIGGTKSEGWFLLDKNTHLAERFNTSILEELKDQRVEDVLVLGDSLYISTYQGVCIQNLHTKEVTCTPVDLFTNGRKVAVNTIMTLEADPWNKNKIYLGSTGGLLHFDVLSRTYDYLAMPNEILNTAIRDEEGPLPLQVRDIYISTDKQLYMSTWGGGLLQYSSVDQTWKRYDFVLGKRDSPRALSYNVSHNIHPYNEDSLLVSVNKYIYIYDIPEEELSILDSSDNWQKDGAGYYNFAFLGMEDGSIVLTNEKTLLRSQAKTSISYPHVSIDHIRLNESSIIPKSRIVEGIEIEGGPNNIEIFLSSPNYDKADRLFFKLEASMSEWQEVSGNTVFLTGVSNSDQLLIKKGEDTITAFSIRILYPIYNRWWFYPSIALLICALIVAFFWIQHRARLKASQIAQDYEMKLSEMEMQTLRAQMNPHFLFNSLNAIKHYSLTKSPYETADYISKFSLLIRKILQNSTQTTLPLKEELEALKLYIEVEALRFQNRFDFTITIDPTLNTSDVLMPPLILQPFIENAIWHGLMHLDERGHLDVKIINGTKDITVTIEDNGIGRVKSMELKQKKAHQRKSYGIDITKSRIQLIEKTHKVKTQFWIDDLYDEAGQASGTRVTLVIPKIMDYE